MVRYKHQLIAFLWIWIANFSSFYKFIDTNSFMHLMSQTGLLTIFLFLTQITVKLHVWPTLTMWCITISAVGPQIWLEDLSNSLIRLIVWYYHQIKVKTKWDRRDALSKVSRAWIIVIWPFRSKMSLRTFTYATTKRPKIDAIGFIVRIRLIC